MSNTTQLHVSRFDADLKARLIEEADAAEISLNDYAVGVLADHFKVRFQGTGRRSPGAAVTNGALMLPVPEALYNKVQAARLRQPKGRKSVIAVVEDVIRAHFAKLDNDLADDAQYLIPS